MFTTEFLNDIEEYFDSILTMNKLSSQNALLIHKELIDNEQRIILFSKQYTSYYSLEFLNIKISPSKITYTIISNNVHKDFDYKILQKFYSSKHHFTILKYKYLTYNVTEFLEFFKLLQLLFKHQEVL